MSRQWPLVLPLMSMLAGLALSLHTQTDSLAILSALLVCLFLSAFQSSKHIFSVCAVLFFFTWGLCALAPWLVPDTSPLSLRMPASDSVLTVEGLVASRPVVSPDGSRLVVRVERLLEHNRSQAVQGSLMLYISEGDVDLLRGDRIRFRTKLSIPRLLGLPGEFNYPRYLALQSISVVGRVASQQDIVLMRGGAEQSLQRSADLLARRLGDAIRSALPDGKISSVLAALLIGDQKRIPQQLSDAYTRAGVNHILSISGFHVGIIAAFISLAILWILTRCEYPALHWNVRRSAVLLALPSMLIYLFITGAAPATARSVIMLGACAVALYMERETDPLNTLLLAAFFLIAINPPTLFDISFQLSFLSLWGIIVVLPPLNERLAMIKHAWLRTLIQFAAVSLAASCVTMIPVLYTFNVASLNGIVTNFLIVPLLGYGAVLAGFCILPFLFIIPDYNHLLLWPAAKLVQLSNLIIERCAELPVIRFYGITAWDMLFFLLFMCSVTFLKSSLKRLSLGVSIPVLAFAVHGVQPGSGDGRLHITMLSVGQAESLLLRLPDGSSMLVDGGGYLHDTGKDFGQRYLAPALAKLGVGRIDHLVSTHDHPDHIGGLAYLARFLPVGEFMSPSDQASETSLELRSMVAQRRIPIRILSAGDRLTLAGGVELQVLSPSRNDSRTRREVMDENEQSLVFRISYGRFSMLFTADAGFAAEQKMIAGGYVLKSTVLKVGHHGSRYSTSSEFLERVQPRVALISSGAGNSFGLPAPRTVDVLASRGIPLYRTDRDGTIELVSDGVSWSVGTPYRPNAQ